LTGSCLRFATIQLSRIGGTGSRVHTLVPRCQVFDRARSKILFGSWDEVDLTPVGHGDLKC
jgi:hypothetical protein